VRVAIHQPQYLPWLGYLAKWAAADLFIVLDVVQYEKQGWQNRNRIKTRAGARWLTVPVHASLGEPISAITIDRSRPWPARHLRAIEHAYARAPALSAYRDELRRFYATPWTRLAALATDSARWLARAFGITTPLRLASELSEGLAPPSTPTGRLVSLCRAAGADTYLAGEHGAAYMDLSEFTRAGIGVLAQRYEHPVYPQVHGEFVSHLSALDLLLTVGEGAFAILRAGDRWTRLLEPRP
jgi:WbqC-like protein family